MEEKRFYMYVHFIDRVAIFVFAILSISAIVLSAEELLPISGDIVAGIIIIALGATYGFKGLVFFEKTQ